MAYVPPLGMPLAEVKLELDRIRHPLRIAVRRSKNAFNVGAIIRTAHSFLVQEIVLIGIEPWYERAAMGMHRFENIRDVPDEASFVELAKREGWHLVALEKDEARSGLWDADIRRDSVLVIGNETDGVGREILDAADEIVSIPMFGLNHSYPMAISAGMALCEWARRQYGQGAPVVITPRGQ